MFLLPEDLGLIENQFISDPGDAADDNRRRELSPAKRPMATLTGF